MQIVQIDDVRLQAPQAGVARRSQVSGAAVDARGPTVVGGGGTGLAASVDGWLLLPVSEWAGGAFPPPDFDLTPQKATMEAGAVIGTRQLALAASVWSAWPPIDVDWAVEDPVPHPTLADALGSGVKVVSLPGPGLWALVDGLDGPFALIRYAP
jgi:hypothetical protein